MVEYQLVGRPDETAVLESLLDQSAFGGRNFPFSFREVYPGEFPSRSLVKNYSPPWDVLRGGDVDKVVKELPYIFYEPSLNPRLEETLRKAVYEETLKWRLHEISWVQLGNKRAIHYAWHHSLIEKEPFPFNLQNGLDKDTALLRVVYADPEQVLIEGKVLASTVQGVVKKELRDAIRDAYGVGDDVSQLYDGLPNPLHFHASFLLYSEKEDTWRVILARYEDSLYEKKWHLLSGKGVVGMKSLADGVKQIIKDISPYASSSLLSHEPPFKGPRLFLPDFSDKYLVGRGGAYIGRDPKTLVPEFLYIAAGVMNDNVTEWAVREKTPPLEGALRWDHPRLLAYGPDAPVHRLDAALYAVPLKTVQMMMDKNMFPPAEHDALLHTLSFLEKMSERERQKRTGRIKRVFSDTL